LVTEVTNLTLAFSLFFRSFFAPFTVVPFVIVIASLNVSFARLEFLSEPIDDFVVKEEILRGDYDDAVTESSAHLTLITMTNFKCEISK